MDEWLEHPVTGEFLDFVLGYAEWRDTEFRRTIRVKAQPYATAENHAWTDGNVEAFFQVGSVKDGEGEFYEECFFTSKGFEEEEEETDE